MEKLDLSSRLNFDDIDLTAPDIVVKELALQIAQETNGIITANVEKYDGPVVSYVTSAGLSASLSGLQAAFGTAEKKIDIQESLGKSGEKSSKYEFYLSTPAFEQYQYRICFLQYGVANYPTKVVLEQSVADEINQHGINSNYIYTCNNRKELEDLIVKIIFSKRIISIMQELIHINQIYQHHNQTSQIDEQIEYESISNDDETME